MNCEQIQSLLLDKKIDHFSAEEKIQLDLHLDSCTNCRRFADLNNLLTATFHAEEPEPAPDYIRQNLLREFRKEEMVQPGLLDMLKNRFPAPYRAGLAFAFSLLFIGLLFKPYLSVPITNQTQSFYLFERQDSLIQHNLKFVHIQKLGISSNLDTLMTTFTQSFP